MNKGHILVCLGIGLSLITGCKEDIDLGKVDTRAEVDLGLVLPIGSAHATFADLLSTKTLGEDFFLDKDSILTYKQTEPYTMTFHDIDWSKFTTSNEIGLPVPGLPAGRQSIEIPITVIWESINQDVNNERIDSIIFSQALLTSRLTKTGLDGLLWDYIETITLHLGEQMSSSEGKDITIYTKGDQGDFGHTFSTILQECTLRLIKDGTSINTWSISATIEANMPEGQTVSAGELTYHYSFAISDYKAVWGYFKPSKDLQVKDTIVLAQKWFFWKKFKDFLLPFDRPSIQIDVNTSVSANVQLDIKEIFLESTVNEDKRYATFMGVRQGCYPYKDQIGLDAATIGQRTTYSAVIDNTVEHGRFDKCFEITPDICAYQFTINPREDIKERQMRLVKDEHPLEINFTTIFPLSFNKGVHVLYTDTIRDVNFTQVALDSLLKNVNEVEEVKKADLNLYIRATNSIPLDIIGSFRFEDEQGQDLHILDSAIVFTAKGTTTFTLTVNEKDFDRIAKTKRIAIDVNSNAESLPKNYIYPIQVKGADGLTLFIGFAGNVDAILNFNNKKQ